MNRLDPVSWQLVARPHISKSAVYLRAGTWAVLGLAVGLAPVLGIIQTFNPTDQTARTLAELPLTLVLVDLWALGVALFRKSDRTPLRVPLKTPLIITGTHLLFWLWAGYLVSFEVFYTLSLSGELGGIYEVRGGIAVLLGGLAVLSFLAAFFEARMVLWVLISEETAVDITSDVPEPGGETDMPLGEEHVYEAQMILHNLGYDVGGIDGTLKEATQDALKAFQESVGLEPGGEVTVLTMIELRNRWRDQEEPAPGQTAKAFSGHLKRQLTGLLASWWRGRKGS